MDRGSLALSTDLYELTMASSYVARGMRETATFSLFVRTLPRARTLLVAAGLEEAVRRVTSMRFDEAAIAYLRSTGRFDDRALDELAAFRFHGDVWAMREGRVFFADEPIVEVTAPILEAQLVETAILNAIHYPTCVASKAARCVAAARGRSVVEFGLRRAPGLEAGLGAARAAYLAGFDATSNVLAGKELGIPLSGTVAHSFVEAFDREIDAFRAAAETQRGPLTLLVDTYDTERGVERAIAVALEMRARGASLSALRIDSGDLDAASRRARAMLDRAGLSEVRIVASGGLDERAIAELTRGDAPIDAYGVGTRVDMASDAPVLDMAYKLVAYAGRPRLKLSEGKATLAGAKQVWRRRDGSGRFACDLVATRDEPSPGEAWEPLLEPFVVAGRARALPTLGEARERHRGEVTALPADLLAIATILGDAPSAPYPVHRSEALDRLQEEAIRAVRDRDRDRASEQAGAPC